MFSDSTAIWRPAAGRHRGNPERPLHRNFGGDGDRLELAELRPAEGQMTAFCRLFEGRRASFRLASTLGALPSEAAVAALPAEFSLRISRGLVLRR